MLKLIVPFLILISLIACNRDKASQQSLIKTKTTENGEQLAQQYCISCHNPQADLNIQTAPPLAMIKDVYLKSYPNKKEFTRNITDWLEAPNPETALLKKSVKKYGLMPNLHLAKNQLEPIINYIYSNSIQKPNWYKIGDGETAIINSNLDELMTIVFTTKKLLGKNLMHQLSQNGTKQALKYCNTNAMNLTESNSQKFGVSIQRVSDKPRNPLNKAHKTDLLVINEYKNALKKDLELKPKMTSYPDSNKIFYVPILTNNMCLQCHGEPRNNINEKVLEEINKLYPSDMAVGYKPNELRGIWKLSLKSNFTNN